MLAPRLFDNSVVANELNAMLQQTRNHGEALDATFSALCGILVFLMQTGFAMLTAGYVGGTCAQIAGRVSLSVCGRERVVRPEIWVSPFSVSSAGWAHDLGTRLLGRRQFTDVAGPLTSFHLS